MVTAFAQSVAFADSAALSFVKADEAFKNGKYEEALAIFNSALKNAFIMPKDKAYALCRKGLIISLSNGFSEAKESLEEALKMKILPQEQESTCSYALLQIYALQEQNQEALDLIEAMGQPTFSPLYLTRVWALGAEVSRRLGNTTKEVVYLRRLLQIMESKGIKIVSLKILGKRVVSLSEVRKRLGIETVAQADQPNALGSSEQNVKNATSGQFSAQGSEGDKVARLIDFTNLALVKLRNGEWSEAKKRWEILRDRKLVGSLRSILGFTPDVDQIIARLTTLQAQDPKQLRIGLIVPSDPELSLVSYHILRAASAFLASPAVNGVDVQIFAQAAVAGPGAVERAVLDLILEKQIHVLIGPVSSALTSGAITVSNLFGVPTMALGPVAESAGEGSPFLVRMGVLAESQASVLVDHVKELGLKNAAIFAPNDAYGVEMARAFSKEAASKQVPVEKVTFFDAESELFNEAVEKALGPQDAESRKEEFLAATLEARKRAKEQKRKFDPSTVKLTPAVRFDALFLPDSLRRARVIASTFAFNDAKNIRFLGDRQWDDGENRRSIADEFLNTARLPRPVEGRYLDHLLMNLGIENRMQPLDLERQVFDAMILSRQGHYLAAGVNGSLMISGLREKSWKLESTTHISGISASGEPLTQYGLWSYLNGSISDKLPPWVGQEWQERVAQQAPAQSE